MLRILLLARGMSRVHVLTVHTCIIHVEGRTWGLETVLVQE